MAPLHARIAPLLMLSLAAAGCAQDVPVQGSLTSPLPQGLALEGVVEGLDDPVFVTMFPAGELAVVEQPGVIRILAGGALRAEPLLDIRDHVGSDGNEQGLLGLAFDPGFEANGHFFVDYTDLEGDTIVERYTLAPGAASAQPASAFRILRIEQPYSNHNGGMLAFGPDGYLYIGTGDGGDGGDPENRAQDKYDLLGKLLRIDVAVPPKAGSGMAIDDVYRPLAYAIPQGNPFADGKDGAPEVWAYGLRNPWRFSFDSETGDLWIGDVGQNAWEEVDMEPAGTPGGRNYGWSAWEGSHRYDGDRQAPGAVPPVVEYQRASGSCAVTGGYVYRGAAMPQLQGTYFFSDYCSGDLWAAAQSGGTWSASIVLETGLSVSSFGEDEAGELYLVDYGGALHKLVPAT